MSAESLDITVVDLGVDGTVRHGDGSVIPESGVHDYLTRRLRPAARTTDIFVYVHGWQTSRRRALADARKLFAGMLELRRRQPAMYPTMESFEPFFLTVRWKSRSTPGPVGYQRIKRRAHRMSVDGRAADILSTLLLTVDDQREPPAASDDLLVTAGGQYLHCLGHSFGGRFLIEAITRTGDSLSRDVLGWPFRSSHPFGIDSLVLFQLAAPHDGFDGELSGILRDAPLHGPAVITHTPYDRALSFWHRLAGDDVGAGAAGVSRPESEISSVTIKPTGRRYAAGDFATRLVNVDSRQRFPPGHLLSPVGAHSGFLVLESAHLALSIAALSRRRGS